LHPWTSRFPSGRIHAHTGASVLSKPDRAPRETATPLPATLHSGPDRPSSSEPGLRAGPSTRSIRGNKPPSPGTSSTKLFVLSALRNWLIVIEKIISLSPIKY
jgi:hypothetical protein